MPGTLWRNDVSCTLIKAGIRGRGQHVPIRGDDAVTEVSGSGVVPMLLEKVVDIFQVVEGDGRKQVVLQVVIVTKKHYVPPTGDARSGVMASTSLCSGVFDIRAQSTNHHSAEADKEDTTPVDRK